MSLLKNNLLTLNLTFSFFISFSLFSFSQKSDTISNSHPQNSSVLKEKDVLMILVNSRGQLLVDEEISTLNKTKLYLSNNTNKFVIVKSEKITPKETIEEIVVHLKKLKMNFTVNPSIENIPPPPPIPKFRRE